jgi:tetratricopeptide (TPR) repeat protein
LRGTCAEGARLLEETSRALAGYASPSAFAALETALAPLYLTLERYAEQLASAERGSAAALECGDRRTYAEAEVWRGCALNQVGRNSEGLGLQERAIPLAERAGDLPSLSHALNDVAFAYEIAGEFERSRRYKEQALDVAIRVGDPVGIANMLFRCGQSAFLRGDWPAARNLFRRATGALDGIDAAIAPYPHFGLALLDFATADFGLARERAERCTVLGERFSDAQAVRAAQGLCAEIDLCEGRPDDALRRLEAMPEEAQGLPLYPIRPILAVALAVLGATERAERIARQVIADARARPNRIILIDALGALARALAPAQPNDAEIALGEAVDLARGIRYPYGEGRTLLTWGQVLEDTERVAQARQVFERLGAPTFPLVMLGGVRIRLPAGSG